MSDLNVVAATPLIITAGAAVLAMGAGMLPGRSVRRHGPAAVGIAGIVAAIAMSAVLWGDRQEAFNGGLRADRFSLLLNVLFLSAALLTILLAWREPAAVDRRGEYVGLILVSATGMMLVAGAGDLISIFLGVEILSVSLYVLCALEVWRERSLESGLKYLITGSVGAAILLYGLTLLFGATGSTSLAVIGDTLGQSSFSDEPLLVAAMALIASGLAFKASAAPFHMWTPDVYEGAPTTVTAFMSTATKAAAFAAFLRLFSGALPDLQPDWQAAIAVIAVASIVVGNIAALVQSNMKRLLAYSSIAQAGYLLIGVAVGTIDGAEAVLYYLLAYGAMTMAAFAVVIVREREVEDGDTVGALRGYGRARPLLGVGDDGVHALARRLPAPERVHRQVPAVRGGRRGRHDLAGRGRRPGEHREPGLLPARGRRHVAAAPAGGAPQGAAHARAGGPGHGHLRARRHRARDVRLAGARRLPRGGGGVAGSLSYGPVGASAPRRVRTTSWTAVSPRRMAKPMRRTLSGAASATRAPATTLTTDARPMVVASRQRTVPARVCRHEPRTATGMIASSEVASAWSWVRPSTIVRVGTKTIPPPTPKRPAAAPAAIPRRMTAATSSAITRSPPSRPPPAAGRRTRR